MKLTATRLAVAAVIVGVSVAACGSSSTPKIKTVVAAPGKTQASTSSTSQPPTKGQVAAKTYLGIVGPMDTTIAHYEIHGGNAQPATALVRSADQKLLVPAQSYTPVASDLQNLVSDNRLVMHEIGGGISAQQMLSDVQLDGYQPNARSNLGLPSHKKGYRMKRSSSQFSWSPSASRLPHRVFTAGPPKVPDGPLLSGAGTPLIHSERASPRGHNQHKEGCRHEAQDHHRRGAGSARHRAGCAVRVRG
jgi:hypothetical protein